VLTWLSDPFAYTFFTRAMIAGVLVGALCGSLSVFIVLRRMSYIGHGLAHAVLGGVAVGLVLGQGMYVGAVAATLLAALLIDRVSRRQGLHADAAIGIVTTAIFAIGIATLSMSPERINVEAVLFGNILGVRPVDLWVVAGVGILLLATLVVAYKRLVFATFDPEVAAVHGVRVGSSEVVFNLLTAAVVVASVRVLGVLLIAAAVVIPGAFARLVSRSLATMIAIATAVGVGSSVVGLYASYHADVPSGPAIVLTATAVFLVGFVASSLANGIGTARMRRPEPDTDASSRDGGAGRHVEDSDHLLT
jgi:ABC-type Mn2+/Zn2+ transport system permease subunit